jgi:hypothetical protein
MFKPDVVERARTLHAAIAGGTGAYSHSKVRPVLQSRTSRTRRVPHPVLAGHAASPTPY